MERLKHNYTPARLIMAAVLLPMAMLGWTAAAAQGPPDRVCLLLGLLGSPCPPGPTMVEQAPNQAGAVLQSFAPVVDITAEEEGVFESIPHASSTLTRNVNGVAATLTTSLLDPGNAYTMWWLVFNNPEFCTGGSPELGFACLPPGDIGDPMVDASVFGGAGQVSDAYGRARFSAHAFVGVENNGLTLPLGPGIIDPFKAEIHLIIQDHGPAQSLAEAGLLEDALMFPGVGCRVIDDQPEPNHGDCAGDIQGAVHLP